MPPPMMGSPMPPPAMGPPPPRFTEEQVAQLKDMFPSFEDEVIREVLASKHGNTDAAINDLLAMQ